jgi:hypothetical protein
MPNRDAPELFLSYSDCDGVVLRSTRVVGKFSESSFRALLLLFRSSLSRDFSSMLGADRSLERLARSCRSGAILKN